MDNAEENTLSGNETARTYREMAENYRSLAAHFEALAAAEEGSNETDGTEHEKCGAEDGSAAKDDEAEFDFAEYVAEVEEELGRSLTEAEKEFLEHGDHPSELQRLYTRITLERDEPLDATEAETLIGAALELFEDEMGYAPKVEATKVDEDDASAFYTLVLRDVEFDDLAFDGLDLGDDLQHPQLGEYTIQNVDKDNQPF